MVVLHNEIDTLESFKICNGCHKKKSVSLFHLKGTDKTGLPRYQSACKSCANSNRIARYRMHKKDAKANKTWGLNSVEIIFHESEKFGPNLTEIMNDYIESIYANKNQATAR